MDHIPVSGPWITQKEIDYVTDAVTNAWYSNANMYHERFEAAFARYLDLRFAVSLPSCTSAIHLALLALGVGPGDEVIVPDCTWIASAAPISYVGATTVFADIDPITWCLSSDSFAAAITPRTRAVIPVNLYGGMPDLKAIRAIASAQGVAVIEDAAESIGSELGGRRAGAWGDVGVFSFHGSKTLTTGEGGMLVTDRADLRDRVLFLRDHGRMPGDRMFRNTEIGWKYKMSSMQAALGLAQLERVDQLIARKREVFSWYAEDLGDAPGVTLNAEPAGTRNSYWMVTAVLAPELGLTKEIVLQRLWDQKIDARPFFHPLSSLPAYAHSPQAAAARAQNRTSYQISPWAVNLPSALNLTRDQVHRVTRTLREWVDSARQSS
ncbi:MAG: DegT/DnrJ/EryC1/StrS family aminotransferase [Verrucomicrobia bacterium]|nr:DegT/DnrJ/EryC1/StrS family aminotransferase [Verrucomicrobiota bacterium]MBI3870105.1 DegT/DnrJ/EryC1/StrS family aminotransferase [Verrucomicrobiota bacterium]